MQGRRGLEVDRVAGNFDRFCRFAPAPVAGAGVLLATVAPANILAVGLADTDEHIRGKLTGRKMARPPVVEPVLLRHICPRAWAVLGQHVCSVELIDIHMAIRPLQQPSPSLAHIIPSYSPAPAIPSAEAPSGMCPSCPCCGFLRCRSSPTFARRWWLWIGCTQHGPLCCSTPQG